MQTVKPWLPAFSLTANDKDITKEVARTLESLTYIDYGATDDEPKSDTLTFSLVSPSMPLPKKGAVLRLALGFDTQLQDKGVFVVSEVSLQSGSGGKKMTVTALATPMDNSKGAALMQTRKTRSWDDVTLGDIVKTIAQENNLSPRISASLADVTPGHQDQTAENDVEFLARLARGFMAVTKIAGGCCIFAEQGDNTAVSGAKLPEVTLTPDGHTRWQFAHRSKRKRKSHSTAGGHQKIRATYIDAGTGETRSILSAGKDPEYNPGFPFPSKAAAEAYISNWQKTWARQDAAAASQKKAKKPRAEYLMSMSITTPCTPDLIPLTSHSKIITDGFDPQADREWLVDNIAFRLGNGGMSVSMELKR
ncbi:MAG: hypothetical protein ACK5L6_02765 [Anaerorhabdus sp.]|uniref:hypothetical protein n=1 Tax=Anaerorhabdus sp. TaxID=1872524 RepID=UPI003A88BEED